MPFVLDNSVVAGWFLENQSTPYADWVATQLQADRALVPTVWELEFTNVLRTACTRQRMNAEHTQAVIATIGRLPIDVDREVIQRSAALACGVGCVVPPATKA